MPTKFTRIKSAYSENIQLPIIGKIRLGLKVRNQKGKEYPVETDYFVCPTDVRERIGEDKPKELNIMFPKNDPNEVFVQRLAWYGQSTGLKCHGNMEEARRYDEATKSWIDFKCPCEHLKTSENPRGECTEQSYLRVFLPQMGFGGCYQITTGSYHSTVQINSQIDLILAITGGRLALLPMKLRRVPRQVTHEGKGRTHYTLELVYNPTIEQIDHIRSNAQALVMPDRLQLEPPIMTNPAQDPVDEEVDDDNGLDAEDLANMDEAELEAVQKALNDRLKAKSARGGSTPPESADVRPNVAGGSKTVQGPDLGTPYVLTLTPWKEIMDAINANSEWTDHKDTWKENNNVDHMGKLQQEGKDDLLTYMREHAKGFPY